MYLGVLPVCVFLHHVCAMSEIKRRSHESAHACSALQCGCWERDLGPREEQAVLSLIRHLAISFSLCVNHFIKRAVSGTVRNGCRYLFSSL